MKLYAYPKCGKTLANRHSLCRHKKNCRAKDMPGDDAKTYQDLPRDDDDSVLSIGALNKVVNRLDTRSVLPTVNSVEKVIRKSEKRKRFDADVYPY